MKEIHNYDALKYSSGDYFQIEDGIYETKEEDEILYVTSLSFIQETELEEGANASEISQYPLEDLLDKYYCYISDFYEEQNTEDSLKCYLEFASPDLEDVKKLRSIIGKHIYNKEVNGSVKLIVE